MKHLPYERVIFKINENGELFDFWGTIVLSSVSKIDPENEEYIILFDESFYSNDLVNCMGYSITENLANLYFINHLSAPDNDYEVLAALTNFWKNKRVYSWFCEKDLIFPSIIDEDRGGLKYI